MYTWPSVCIRSLKYAVFFLDLLNLFETNSDIQMKFLNVSTIYLPAPFLRRTEGQRNRLTRGAHLMRIVYPLIHSGWCGFSSESWTGRTLSVMFRVTRLYA